MDNSKSGYSEKELAMFAIFPFVKAASPLLLNPISKIAITQQKSAMAPTGPLNVLFAIRHILSNGGLKGFYDGLAASMTREGYKTCYKGLLQVKASALSKDLIPDTIYGAYFLRGAIAGSLVGTIDSILVAPVERYKTYKISQEKIKGDEKPVNFKSYYNEIKRQQLEIIAHKAKLETKGMAEDFFCKIVPNFNLKKGIVEELFCGTGVTIIKQSLMNMSFFTTKEWANGAVKPYENEYPIMAIIFASVAAGLGAAVVGAPLDIVKTLKQQQTGKKISTKVLLIQVYSQAGYKGLFVGVPARFVLITCAYGLNGLFLNVFEKIRKQDSDIEALTKRFQPLSVGSDEDELTKQFEQLSVSPLEKTPTPVIFMSQNYDKEPKFNSDQFVAIPEKEKPNSPNRLGRE